MKKKKAKQVKTLDDQTEKGTPSQDTRSINLEFNGIAHSIPLLGTLQVKHLSILEIKEALNRNAAELAYWEDIMASVESELQGLEDIFEVKWSRWYTAVSSIAPKGVTEGWKKSTIIVKHSKEYKLYLRNKRSLVFIKNKIKALVKGYETQSRTLQSVAGLSKSQLARLGADPSFSGPESTGKKNLEEI